MSLFGGGAKERRGGSRKRSRSRLAGEMLTFFLETGSGLRDIRCYRGSRAESRAGNGGPIWLVVWCSEALKCQPCPVTYLLCSARVRVVEKEMATQKTRRQGGLGGLWAASISARKKAVSGMLPPSHHAARAARAFGGVQACRTAHSPRASTVAGQRHPRLIRQSQVQGAAAITGESAHLFLTSTRGLASVEFENEKCRGAGV